MKPILFIGHDAGRTGAPILLLHVCRWMARRHARPFEVLLGRPGALANEFATLAPTTVLEPETDPAASVSRLQAIAERASQGEFALVYGNTVEVSELLEACTGPTTPAITHVHELDFWLRHHTGLSRFSLVRDGSDRMIAVSRAVRASLVGQGVDPDAIDLVYGAIETSQWVAGDAHRTLRAELGIPDSALVVGGAGTLDWRKGVDLFLRVAHGVRKHNVPRPVHFVWMGGSLDDDRLRFAELRHDAAQLGLGACLHFTGHRPDPASFYGLLDVFLLTSREDPFPLVVLEAAAAGVPTVCFDGAGGAPEFVADDCGAVAPALDIDAMAEQTWRLLSADAERRRCGECARDKVRARHDVSDGVRRIVDIIEATIAAGPSVARLARAAEGASHQATTAAFGLYQLAVAEAAAGNVARARELFHTFIQAIGARNADLAGKAFYKLALLAETADDTRRLLEQCLTRCPGHREAARRLAGLTAAAG
jgi:glycosyltransferase involved in cell wall biosynthesis